MNLSALWRRTDYRPPAQVLEVHVKPRRVRQHRAEKIRPAGDDDSDEEDETKRGGEEEGEEDADSSAARELLLILLCNRSLAHLK